MPSGFSWRHFFLLFEFAAAMSFQRGNVRWRESMAACLVFVSRSSAALHNLLEFLSPLRGSALAAMFYPSLLQQPCHSYVGMCGGMESMAAYFQSNMGEIWKNFVSL